MINKETTLDELFNTAVNALKDVESGETFIVKELLEDLNGREFLFETELC